MGRQRNRPQIKEQEKSPENGGKQSIRFRDQSNDCKAAQGT